MAWEYRTAGAELLQNVYIFVKNVPDHSRYTLVMKWEWLQKMKFDLSGLMVKLSGFGLVIYLLL